MKSLLITSGFVQITVAVLLGWVIAAFRLGAVRVGPLRNAKRVLQCHIDDIMMGLLQFAVAVVHPAIPPVAGWLLLIGSWTNAQLFLVHAFAENGFVRSRVLTVITFASFATLTVAYPWLLWAWLQG